MPKSSSRKYTEEFKREAVTLVLEEGQKVSEVARNLGIDRSTLDRWCRQLREAPEVACGDCAYVEGEESRRSSAKVPDAKGTDATSHSFYRAFEDRYRGSRERIKARLRVYLAFVEPLKEICAHCRAVDLGCGRGEWLELMHEAGIDAHGIDLDDGMLAVCREEGLSVEQRDAMDYLRSLPGESVAVVSAFHVAEHIPFAALQALVQEALRVLVPAGLLILETPNPENLRVGACSFYYDPTHQRPIPPLLLSFLPEHYGFARTKVLRLQEAAGLPGKASVTLSEVLLGVSPDYAVVAQKGSEDALAVSRFDAAFGEDYGVDLDSLAMTYDSNVNDRLGEILARVDRSAELEARVQQAESRAQAAEGLEAELRVRLQQAESREAETQLQLQQALERTQQAEARAEGREAEARGRLQQALERTQQAEARAQRAEAASMETLMHLQAVHGSTSWRLTRPLRWLGSVLPRRSDVIAVRRARTSGNRMIDGSLSQPRVVAVAQTCLAYARNPSRLLRRVAMALPTSYQRMRGAPATMSSHEKLDSPISTVTSMDQATPLPRTEPDIDAILVRIREEIEKGSQ